MENRRATALWEGAAVPGDWFAYVDTDYRETGSGYYYHLTTRVALLAADHVTDVADPAARIPCATGAPIFLADESRVEDLRTKRYGVTRYDEEHGFCVGLYFRDDTPDLQVFVGDAGRATGFVIETPSEEGEDEYDDEDEDNDDDEDEDDEEE